MKPQKKILFMSTKSVLGGAQRHIIDIVENLPKEKFECAAAAGGAGPFASKIKAIGIPYYRIKGLERDIGTARELVSYFKIAELLSKVKPDIVHLHGSKISVLGAIAARMMGVGKIVSSSHGWAFLEHRSSSANRFLRAVTKIGARFQDEIICVSEHDYNIAKRFRVARAGKLHRVHNGIDAAAHVFLERRSALKKLAEMAGLRTQRPIVFGTVAEYTKNKGLVYLVEAARHIARMEPRAVFLLIGWGEQENMLRKKIANLNLERHAFLITHIEDAYTYMKAFDYFILPSVKEGFPYTLLEASLAELPIITTRVGGSPEIIENLKTGLVVDPAAPEAIINAARHLLREPADCAEFARAARAKVASEFTIKKMVEKIEKIYSS